MMRLIDDYDFISWDYFVKNNIQFSNLLLVIWYIIVIILKRILEDKIYRIQILKFPKI